MKRLTLAALVVILASCAPKTMSSLTDKAFKYAERHADDPGALWKLYEFNGKERFAELADSRLDARNVTWSTYGNGWVLTGDEKYLPAIREGAEQLAAQEFDGDLVKLRLLTEAAALFGEPELSGIAQSRAKSVWTSKDKAKDLYGFTMMYRQTGVREFLTRAQSLAEQLEEGVDENGPEAAIMASAFVQLYEIDGNGAHLRAAERQLRALAAKKDVSYYFLEALLCYRRATSHPRLLLGRREFESLKRQIASGSNEPLVRLHSMIMQIADSDDGAPVERIFDESGRRLLQQSRKALTRIFFASYAYRYTGDRKYVRTVEKTIEEVCAFENWNPSHFLDVAEMCAAVGIGYDWLHDELRPEIKEMAEKAVKEFGFDQAADKDGNAWFYDNLGNWNQVCNGGLTLAALAMREVMDTTSGRILTDAVASNTRIATQIYSPDGNYSEGPGYWSYGNIFQALLNTCLETATGDDFGLSVIDGFDKTADYVLFTYGGTGKMFNYSDNGAAQIPSYPLWYFAWKYRNPSLLFKETELMKNPDDYVRNENVRLLPLLACWVSKVDTEGAKRPDGHFYVGRGANPVVIARGDWSETDSDFFLGVKGAAPQHSHAHLDGGSFVFESDGVRWFSDPGRTAYAAAEKRLQATGGDFWDMSQDSQRWDCYPLGNEWHTTISVDGRRHDVKGFGTLEEAIDEPGRQGGSFELGSLLDGLAGARRTVTTDGKSLSVTDEFTARRPCRIRLTFVTETKAELLSEGVRLSQDGRTRMLKCDAPLCRYSIRNSPEAASHGMTLIDIDFPAPVGKSFIKCDATVESL